MVFLKVDFEANRAMCKTLGVKVGCYAGSLGLVSGRSVPGAMIHPVLHCLPLLRAAVVAMVVDMRWSSVSADSRQAVVF